MSEKYYWLNDKSRKFLSSDYLYEGVTPEQRVRDISIAAEKYLKIKGFASKLEEYIALGWISLSTPIWANFGLERGLPISCFSTYIPDTMNGILEKNAEIGMMTKMGGGTSAYFGDLRARGVKISTGGESSGPIHFMELFEATTNIISQSSIRRGSFAAYLPVEHPDILEFLKIRSEGHKIQHLSIGVCITDKWMESMLAGDKDKRKVWGEIIKKRFESGYPYIFFTDTVNKKAPQVYKDKDLKINNSNLCAEVTLSTNEKESFVCDLAAVNLLHYDDWKDTDLVETVIYLLDAVMTEFINKAENTPFMSAPVNFAKNQRALGLGVLGWHSYLQSKMIEFESFKAKMLNVEIFKLLNQKSLKATKELSKLYGEPPLLKGYGVRNVTRLALMPTTSSSFILGQVSPSIEPLSSNYFVKDLAKGKFTYKNPYLKDLLAKYDKDDNDTWKSILIKGGSVQHLDFLTTEEKGVFKTFGEISQKEIVIQASQRQQYICQSQSLNLMVGPKIPAKEVSELLIEGWHLGIKTFYYQRSANPSQELSRSLSECKSCQA